jgi:excisionase family DNA binding protein
MNKEQAAKKLKISVRTLQRHMAKHKIAYKMKRTKTGEVADFDKEEVERFKRELKEGLTDAVTHGAVESEAVRPQPLDEQSTALARVDTDTMQFAALFYEYVLNNPPKRPAAHGVPIENKFMLTVAEAAALSGISVGKIREAIRGGKLKAHKGYGRGMGKVSRKDLDAYCDNL